MRDEHGIASDPLQPSDDVLRISHAAAEQEQLRLRRREREGEFVMHAAHRVGDHLIFVDHEKLRAIAPKEPRALRFQRRDDHLGVEIQGEIARGDADVPAARTPFREFVVRERARRDGEDRLPFQRRVEQLEDVGLARAGRRLDHDILARLQGAHRFLLPEIRDDQVDLESLEHWREHNRCFQLFLSLLLLLVILILLLIRSARRREEAVRKAAIFRSRGVIVLRLRSQAISRIRRNSHEKILWLRLLHSASSDSNVTRTATGGDSGHCRPVEGTEWQ